MTTPENDAAANPNSQWRPDKPDEPRQLGDILTELGPLIGQGLTEAEENRKIEQRGFDRGSAVRELEQERERILAGLEGREPDARTQADLDNLQRKILEAIDDVFGTTDPPR